jgi:hypothetical protein
MHVIVDFFDDVVPVVIEISPDDCFIEIVPRLIV